MISPSLTAPQRQRQRQLDFGSANTEWHHLTFSPRCFQCYTWSVQKFYAIDSSPISIFHHTQFAVFDSGASLSSFVLSLIFAIGGNIIARQANVARGDGKPTLARIKLQDSASTNPQCQPSSDQNRNGGFDLSNQEIQFCKKERTK